MTFCHDWSNYTHIIDRRKAELLCFTLKNNHIGYYKRGRGGLKVTPKSPVSTKTMPEDRYKRLF